jgi:hypothetical protein
LNKEVKRRIDVVGLEDLRPKLPNEASFRRLVDTVLPEQNDDWQLQHRYLYFRNHGQCSDIDETAMAALSNI